MKKLSDIAEVKVKNVFDNKLDTDFTMIEIKNLENGRTFVGADDKYTPKDIEKICDTLEMFVTHHYVEDELAKHNLIDYSSEY